ncbi:putative 2-hydroxychromene-2-carboxylate isomerase [Microthyrium microscopicum]|uniref:Glutathione S-transferase kappa n=1 Tax=Microthyrium microscopicum TaxID=703497 RepID=A0A6A6UDL5_9PEZI|nr:putative 2-hydroxychromene-2-carboxylate isomerase [Microthyrium microscopicum]
MPSPKLKLYFDTVSPFAYFAFWALENLPAFKNVEKTYVPIFLGGLMKACDNRPPIEITNKNKWIYVERLRWAKQFNIPLKPETPEGFPVLTLTPQRALTAVSILYPELLVQCTSAVYTAFWVEHTRINEPAALGSVLGSVLANDQLDKVMQATSTKDVKDGLSEKTQEAFDTGAFGMPWFVATNKKGETEAFWGFDHLGQVADHLGLERPLQDGWRAML